MYKERLGQVETLIRQCAVRLQITEADSLSLKDAAAFKTRITDAYEAQKEAQTGSGDAQMLPEYEGKKMQKEIMVGSREVPIQSLKLQEAFGRYTD